MKKVEMEQRRRQFSDDLSDKANKSEIDLSELLRQFQASSPVLICRSNRKTSSVFFEWCLNSINGSTEV